MSSYTLENLKQDFEQNNKGSLVTVLNSPIQKIEEAISLGESMRYTSSSARFFLVFAYYYPEERIAMLKALKNLDNNQVNLLFSLMDEKIECGKIVELFPPIFSVTDFLGTIMTLFPEILREDRNNIDEIVCIRLVDLGREEIIKLLASRFERKDGIPPAVAEYCRKIKDDFTIAGLVL